VHFAPLSVGEGRRSRGEVKKMKTTGVIKLQRLSDGKLSQARKLRCNMTPPEYKLWQRIRNKQLGVKFRRQQVIEGFIVDFYCEKARLVIEVDGESHNSEEQKSIDEHRKNVFKARGLKEIRFKNEQIETAIEMVICEIKESIESAGKK
jgi:very-short-patch-repair endonuclease